MPGMLVTCTVYTQLACVDLSVTLSEESTSLGCIHCAIERVWQLVDGICCRNVSCQGCVQAPEEPSAAGHTAS